MPFYILGLMWDDQNEAHIARHAIIREELEEVCYGNPWVLRARGKKKFALSGQTSAGRYLLVILARRGRGI